MSTTEDIKKLREETSVSVAVCKKALEEAGGDFDKALLVLKKESAKIAEKKVDRLTAAGVIASYVHNDRIGVLVEVRCETDFVARTSEFKEFAYNLAMHVAAMNPHFLSEDDVPEDVKKEMFDIFAKDTESLDKPEDIKAKIISGKLDSYVKERSFYSQPYVKNQDISINDYIKEMIQKFGENITVSRFQRFEI